jgi:branched-chain amino acid transport system permease protein
MAGQINLGQSAFVGIGAYVAAALSGTSGVPFWLAIPAGGMAAGAASILFGLPAVRVKGFYLALTTIAAQVIFPIVVLRLPVEWFGGANGLAVEPAAVLGHTLGTPTDMYYLCLAVILVLGMFAFNLQRSRTGRAFRALRDNDVVTAVLGINLFRYKVLAFFAGAFFGGIAGALYAYYVRYVTTDQFTLWLSVWYIGMLIVGGLHSPLGAILGTVFITIVQETIHHAGTLLVASRPGISGGIVFAGTNIILGGAIVLALIYEPHGLAHRWNLIKAAYRIWPYSHS